RIDRDHVRRARRPRRLERAQAHGPQAEHGDHLAGAQPALEHRVVAGAHHVPGEQRDLIAHPLGHLSQHEVGVRHQRPLGLRALERAQRGPVSEGARLIALVKPPAPAEEAASAGRLKAPQHAVANLHLADVCADRGDVAHVLVADPEARIDLHPAVVDVPLSAAYAAGLALDDRVCVVQELRRGHLLHEPLAGGLEGDCAHRRPTLDARCCSVSAPVRRTHTAGPSAYAPLMPDPSKAVLITGCSSGIGRATALRLLRSGWRVYATARRPEAIAELQDAGCRTLALDVTSEPSMSAAVEELERAEGAVGVLINNAGYSQSGAIETVPIDAARRQFETNVFGLVRLTQLVLPKMRAQRWGKIVNVGSMGGRLTFPGGGYYHATKHALEAISDALRFELRGFGIDVILLEPGLITTAFCEVAAASM